MPIDDFDKKNLATFIEDEWDRWLRFCCEYLEQGPDYADSVLDRLKKESGMVG